MLKIIREHRSVAIDLTPSQDAIMENQNDNLITKIDNLLQQAQNNNEISGYHFDYMFKEDVSHEYKD